MARALQRTIVFIAAIPLGTGVITGCTSSGKDDSGSLTRAQVEERLSAVPGFNLPLPQSLPGGYVLIGVTSTKGKEGRAVSRQAEFVPVDQDPARSSISLCAEEKGAQPWQRCGSFDSPGGTVRRELGPVLAVIRIPQSDPKALDQWRDVKLVDNYDGLTWLKD